MAIKCICVCMSTHLSELAVHTTALWKCWTVGFIISFCSVCCLGAIWTREAYWCCNKWIHENWTQSAVRSLDKTVDTRHWPMELDALCSHIVMRVGIWSEEHWAKYRLSGCAENNLRVRLSQNVNVCVCVWVGREDTQLNSSGKWQSLSCSEGPSVHTHTHQDTHTTHTEISEAIESKQDYLAIPRSTVNGL